MIPVADWFLYVNTPGHGLPLSAMEAQEWTPAVPDRTHEVPALSAFDGR